jgi:hypothetical protein
MNEPRTYSALCTPSWIAVAICEGDVVVDIVTAQSPDQFDDVYLRLAVQLAQLQDALD